jgi:hypothetical protein
VFDRGSFNPKAYGADAVGVVIMVVFLSRLNGDTFEQRAARGKTEALPEILASVPDKTPTPGNERESNVPEFSSFQMF